MLPGDRPVGANGVPVLRRTVPFVVFPIVQVSVRVIFHVLVSRDFGENTRRGDAQVPVVPAHATHVLDVLVFTKSIPVDANELGIATVQRGVHRVVRALQYVARVNFRRVHERHGMEARVFSDKVTQRLAFFGAQSLAVPDLRKLFRVPRIRDERGVPADGTRHHRSRQAPSTTLVHAHFERTSGRLEHVFFLT